MDKQPQQSRGVSKQSPNWYIAIFALAGDVFGFIGYLLLEKYFRFSYREGLGGLFTPFVVMFWVIMVSNVLGVIVFFITRKIQKYSLISGLGIMLVISGILATAFFYHFQTTLADQLPGIRQEAQDYSQLEKAKNIQDCGLVSASYLWSACIKNKVVTESDFQVCTSQATSRGYDKFDADDCLIARAKGTQDAQYCRDVSLGEFTSCASYLIDSQSGDGPLVPLTKAITICRQMVDAHQKNECYRLLMNDYYGFSDQAQLSASQQQSLKLEICAGLQKQDLQTYETEEYQSVCPAT